MKTEDAFRSIDFSALGYTKFMCAIQALLSRRANPMREKEIAHWFRATPKAYISWTLMEMLDHNHCKGGSTSLSRRQRVMCYWVTGEWD